MTYTLLIWEEVPENTLLFLIPNDVADQYRHYLEQAHNKMINAIGWEQYEGLDFLNYAIYKKEDQDLPDIGGGLRIEQNINMEKYIGVLANYKMDVQQPLIDTHITAVYFSGFIM